MISVGIDPGLKGGVVALHVQTARLLAWRIPTIKTSKGRTVRNRLDEQAMWRLAGLLASMGPRIVALEGVGGMPRQSAHRAFVFGDLCGAIRMALIGAGLTVERPPAALWKGHLGLKGGENNKGDAVDKATELFPLYAHLWSTPKGVLDGIAEAALIAHYAATVLVPGPPC